MILNIKRSLLLSSSGNKTAREANTGTITCSDKTATDNLTAESATPDNVTVTDEATAGKITVTGAGNGTSDVAVTYTGKYYKGVIVYTVTSDGSSSNIVSIAVKTAYKVSAVDPT